MTTHTPPCACQSSPREFHPPEATSLTSDRLTPHQRSRRTGNPEVNDATA